MAANFGASLCSMNFQYPKFETGPPETGYASAETSSIGGPRKPPALPHRQVGRLLAMRGTNGTGTLTPGDRSSPRGFLRLRHQRVTPGTGGATVTVSRSAGGPCVGSRRNYLCCTIRDCVCFTRCDPRAPGLLYIKLPCAPCAFLSDPSIANEAAPRDRRVSSCNSRHPRRRDPDPHDGVGGVAMTRRDEVPTRSRRQRGG
jgi:hypothetical protein